MTIHIIVMRCLCYCAVYGLLKLAQYAVHSIVRMRAITLIHIVDRIWCLLGVCNDNNEEDALIK